MNKITICLWFDSEAEEVAKYYIDTFKSAPGEHEARILNTIKYPEATEEVSGKPAGSVMTVEYELDGVKFMNLNGGANEQFKLNGATSFIITCGNNQEEIDHFWGKLSAVPEAEQCGWCVDRFGVTWQITPKILDELIADPTKAEKVAAAFLQMKKIDVEAIMKAGE